MTNIIINGKEIKKTSEITACQKETIIKDSSLYDQDRKGHYLFKEGQSFNQVKLKRVCLFHLNTEYLMKIFTLKI